MVIFLVGVRLVFEIVFVFVCFIKIELCGEVNVFVLVWIFFLISVFKWCFEFNRICNLFCFFFSVFCFVLSVVFFSLVKLCKCRFKIVLVWILFNLKWVINVVLGLFLLWIILIILLMFKNVMINFLMICKWFKILFNW